MNPSLPLPPNFVNAHATATSRPPSKTPHSRENLLSRPFGTEIISTHKPGVKTPGYSHASLRDGPSVVRPLLASIAAFGLCIGSASALELNFDQAVYEVSPGDSVALTVAFNQPVPNDLDAYALRLLFPADAVALDDGDIDIVSELDHDLFAEGPAERNVTSTSATLRGFADFFEGPYDGTAFVTFHVTVPINAPGGEHVLQLGVADPDGNNFIDGAQAVIDDQIAFGAATLNVDVPVPETIEPIFRNATTGHVGASFSGIPGREYRILASANLQDWSPIVTLTAAQDGTFSFTDTEAAEFSSRFYRVWTD